MKQTFYSHGKLLLTAEYFVLDGAQALAVPCKFGQSLEVSPNNTPGVKWISKTLDGEIWFEHHFSYKDIQQTPKIQPKSVAETLQKILHFASQAQTQFFEEIAVVCETNLEFPRDWGLGTSSTLINNISLWTKVDAYSLLEQSFGGSGYDIAAAKCKNPFLYQTTRKPRAKELALDWPFTDQIFFIHLNQKQDSKEGIQSYRAKTAKLNLQAHIQQASQLTQDFLNANSIDELGLAIDKHEAFVSDFIGMQPLKQKLFADYPHFIKSLGAWGGDFFMALGTQEEMQYFKQKGYNVILAYKEMCGVRNS